MNYNRKTHNYEQIHKTNHQY